MEFVMRHWLVCHTQSNEWSMIRSARWAALLISFLAALCSGHPVSTKADGPVVRAVLFFSPTCSHCHQVMTEDLPPLMERYGEQLQILTIDATQPEGQTLYRAAVERYAIPEERWGVPAMFVGETLLVGSSEIPEQLPGLIEYHLANGGVDWPDIPGLTAMIPQAAEEIDGGAAPGQTTSQAMPVSAPEDQASMIDRFNRDPAGNSLSVLVLLGMIISLLITTVRLVYLQARAGVHKSIARWRRWTVTALCIAGLGIALYLAYVEITQTPAVCGPVGDCNTVQQSEYARLFGLIPIGILGAAGYVLILAAWWLEHFASGILKHWAALSVFGMTVFGALFSVYLTFLEPFVIGATCAWCLSSAVLMTVILLLVTDLGTFAWPRLTLTPRRRRVSATRARKEYLS